MSKIEIKKIRLEIGKKKIDLSLQEARELQRILADLLGIEEERAAKTIFAPIEAPIVTKIINVPYPAPVFLKPVPVDHWKVVPMWDGFIGTSVISGIDSTGDFTITY